MHTFGARYLARPYQDHFCCQALTDECPLDKRPSMRKHTSIFASGREAGVYDLIWWLKNSYFTSLQANQQNLWWLSHLMCVTGCVWQIGAEKVTGEKTCSVLRLLRISLSHWALTHPPHNPPPTPPHTHTHTRRQTDRHLGPWRTLAAVCAIILSLLWFWATFKMLSVSLVMYMLPIKRLAVWHRWYSICVSRWSNRHKLYGLAAKLTRVTSETQFIMFDLCQNKIFTENTSI